MIVVIQIPVQFYFLYPILSLWIQTHVSELLSVCQACKLFISSFSLCWKKTLFTFNLMQDLISNNDAKFKLKYSETPGRCVRLEALLSVFAVHSVF